MNLRSNNTRTMDRWNFRELLLTFPNLRRDRMNRCIRSRLSINHQNRPKHRRKLINIHNQIWISINPLTRANQITAIAMTGIGTATIANIRIPTGIAISAVNFLSLSRRKHRTFFTLFGNAFSHQKSFGNNYPNNYANCEYSQTQQTCAHVSPPLV